MTHIRGTLADMSGDAQPRLASPGPSTTPGEAIGAVPWQNPAFGPGYNAFAPRISVDNGQTMLNEHGNRRLLQPNEIASAQAYVDDHFAKFSPFQGNVWGSGLEGDPFRNQTMPMPDPAPMMGGTLGSMGGMQLYSQQRGPETWSAWATPNLRNQMRGEGWTPTGSSYQVR